MEREEIIKKFQKNKFDNETIEWIVEAIEDFKEVELDKYVPIDEVVDRICKNLKNGIEFAELKEGTLGWFMIDDAKIQVSKNLEKNSPEFKSVIFHELIHSITAFKELDMIGFHTILTDPMNPNNKRAFGYGLNEGVTSYIERKRAVKKGYEVGDSYPILNSLVENLILVIGKRDILDSYFNEPERLEEILESKGMDELMLTEGFDEIRRNESEVIRIKRSANSKESRLLMSIFGEGNNHLKEIYEKIGDSVGLINDELFNAIDRTNNLKDFEKITKFIARLEKQEFGMDKNKIYGRLLKEQKRLTQMGIQEEDTDKIIGNCGIEANVDLQRTFEKLNVEDKDELMIQLYNAYEGRIENEEIEDIINEPSYSHYLKEKLFHRNIPMKIEKFVFVGKILKENPDIDLDEISLKEYKDFTEDVIVAETMQDRKFAYIDIAERVEEFSKDNIAKIDDKEWDIDYEIELKDDEAIVTDHSDDTKTECPLCKEVISNCDYELNELKRRLEYLEKTLQSIENMGAPSIIKDKQLELIEEAKEKIEEKKQEFKNRKKKKVINSKEMEAFEGKLSDVETADKKSAEMQQNIKLIQQLDDKDGQNIGDDE